MTAGSIIVINWAWTAIGGGPMPLHGSIALSLGVAGTVALAWGLMALAFRSDREGWDARANRADDADSRPLDKP
ncbi:hypothetical protein [Brevundimonas sp.]|uniref:hypothetical protein n=1 Tax=Brevundimonas sp. TaxID=1871086 RepID=UPI00391BBC58